MNNFEKIQELLRIRAELRSRLKLIPYDKASEFKQKLVLYYENKDLSAVKVFLKECVVKL